MFLVLQGIWCSKALPSTPVLSELFLINKHDKVLSRKKKRHVTMSNIHKRNMPKLTAVAKVCVREVAGILCLPYTYGDYFATSNMSENLRFF